MDCGEKLEPSRHVGIQLLVKPLLLLLLLLLPLCGVSGVRFSSGLSVTQGQCALSLSLSLSLSALGPRQAMAEAAVTRAWLPSNIRPRFSARRGGSEIRACFAPVFQLISLKSLVESRTAASNAIQRLSHVP